MPLAQILLLVSIFIGLCLLIWLRERLLKWFWGLFRRTPEEERPIMDAELDSDGPVGEGRFWFLVYLNMVVSAIIGYLLAPTLAPYVFLNVEQFTNWEVFAVWVVVTILTFSTIVILVVLGFVTWQVVGDWWERRQAARAEAAEQAAEALRQRQAAEADRAWQNREREVASAREREQELAARLPFWGEDRADENTDPGVQPQAAPAAPANQPPADPPVPPAPPNPPTRSRVRLALGIAGGCAALLILLAVVFSGPSREEQLVSDSEALEAQAVLNYLVTTDPRYKASCPKGWEDTCRSNLEANKIPLPPCHNGMDKDCGSASMRMHREKTEVQVVDVSFGEWEEVQIRTNANWTPLQKAVLKSGDLERIGALIQNPKLSREAILETWALPGVPLNILAHPSLTPEDVTSIYAEVQANGLYDAIPWLIINPNLDPDVRGMWVSEPVGDPVERKRRILLGLHQPEVPAAAVEYLVRQAVKEGTEQGDFSLWQILLEAAKNGDVPVRDNTDPPINVVEQMKAETADTMSGFANLSAAVDWDHLEQACRYEHSAGRHSPAVMYRSAKVVPKMVNVTPAVTPPVPAAPPQEIELAPDESQAQ